MNDADRSKMIAFMGAAARLMEIGREREEALTADAARHARDVTATLADYHDECAASRALLTALEDIALLRVPPLPAGIIRDHDKLVGAMRDHAATAVRVYEGEEPTPMMKAAIVMHDSLLKSK
jgi:hypothetical protein